MNWDYWLTWVFRGVFIYYIIRGAISLRGLLTLGQEDRIARQRIIEAQLVAITQLTEKVTEIAKHAKEPGH